MKKLLAAVVAGLFALSTAPAVLAAKHEMKKEEKAMKSDAKKTEGKAKKGEGKKTEGKAKKGEGKKKEK